MLGACGTATADRAPLAPSTTRGPTTTTAPASHDLTGTIFGGACSAGGDPYFGLPVTVTNQSGQVVGTGSVGGSGLPLGSSGACTDTFNVGQVPAHETFYGIHIGSLPVVNFSLAQVKQSNWDVWLGTSS